MSDRHVAWPRRFSSLTLAVCLVVSVLASASAVAYPAGDDPYDRLTEQKEQRPPVAPSAVASAASIQSVSHNFTLLGHTDLGASDTNGDVWVHGDYAYVGTWSDPCTGGGVKVVDVSDLTSPQLIGRIAERPGTSSEDVVVRQVKTDFFSGDLAAVGIQRCGADPALDSQQFGVELWDVTDPTAPSKLGELGVTNGGGGVHELDLFQRGGNLYALLATPFSEAFDPVPGGDFRIVDVTDPTAPFQVGEFGAIGSGLSPGPFFGQGSFGAAFDHSARASSDGMKAYVSYWDLGVLTLDISDVTQPTLLSQTRYRRTADGEAHSVAEYQVGGNTYLLQNDEDFDPRSPAEIHFGRGNGIGNESPGGTALWLQPGHRLRARVVEAAGQGCFAVDYPANTAGKIAVVRTPFPFFDPSYVPGVSEEPACLQQDQDAAAAAAGAVAVVHDFIAEATSPQWFDFGDVGIPVLFTDHRTARKIVRAGRASLLAQSPSWGFLRVFDAATGRQVASFDDLPNVHALPSPEGDWSIHNTEVSGHIAFSSWYSNGVVALDLSHLPRNPKLVGQFVPEGAPAQSDFLPSGIPLVWGVAIRPSDHVVFLSDMNGGLWIVQPTGSAAS